MNEENTTIPNGELIAQADTPPPHEPPQALAKESVPPGEQELKQPDLFDPQPEKPDDPEAVHTDKEPTPTPSQPVESLDQEMKPSTTEPVQTAPAEQRPGPAADKPEAPRIQSESKQSESQKQEQGKGKNQSRGKKGKKKPESSRQKSDSHPPTPKKSRKERYKERKEKERAREAAILEAATPVESEGIVEISPKGFGFLRERSRGFNQSPKDVFITPEVVRIHGLRDGLLVKCISKEGVRGPQLVELLQINGQSPDKYHNLPYFEELTAINPDKRLTLETSSSRMTTRVIDLVTPIGRGQRGLIVSPPRTGKTTLLQHIAEGILQNYEEMHLMVLLIDERPEEVTDFERSFPHAEVLSSSNDGDAKDHTRIALLAIERAKRLVEAGEHVFILMDSITRLARAFNNSIRGGRGRGTGSGGLTVGALEMPRRIFAAARNTREAGSLTIIATALIQTNSKADEAIFQEFKGTGNMELVLDRQMAQNYIYPAVDINRSGTRREELLLPPHMLEKIYVIRRGLSTYKPIDAIEWLLRCMERYPSNAQMLMDIKTTALS